MVIQVDGGGQLTQRQIALKTTGKINGVCWHNIVRGGSPTQVKGTVNKQIDR